MCVCTYITINLGEKTLINYTEVRAIQKASVGMREQGVSKKGQSGRGGPRVTGECQEWQGIDGMDGSCLYKKNPGQRRVLQLVFYKTY